MRGNQWRARTEFLCGGTTNQNHYLTGKAPYRFESIPLHGGVCKLSVPRAPHAGGYSWFCDLYRVWAGRLKPTMRQTHLAGEKIFVDLAGRTGEVVDGLTGEIIPMLIFVAVLGASSFSYAEAVWSQKLPDWHFDANRSSPRVRT